MMEDLPAELLHNVFSYLKPHEIPPLRQVCRILATIGLHYMIPELHLLPLPGNFDRLAEVANHPVLSQHLRKIVYEGYKLPLCVSRGQFDEAVTESIATYWNRSTVLFQRPSDWALHDKWVEEKIGWIDWGKRITETSWETAWAHYQKIQLYQQTHLDVTILRSSIEKMPRLEEVELIVGFYEALIPIWNAYLPCLVAPHYKLTMDTGVEQLKAILEAASAANKSMRRLKVMELGCRFFDQPFDLSRVALQSLEHLTLKVLSLNARSFYPWDTAAVPSEDRIGEFLGLAYNLKVLSLEFEG